MRTNVLSRGVIILLAVVLLGVLVACGGGKGASRSTLPTVDRQAETSSETGFRFTDADIPSLSPELQGYLALPGWNGPPSPVPPVSGAPMPEPLSLEDFIQMRQDLFDQSGDLTRSEDPIVPTKGSSYGWIPPEDPDYFPSLGEYDPVDWDGPPPTAPPFGLDEDNDLREDLFENVDPLGILTYASFVKRGTTIPNQFNRGSTVAGNAVSVVYQSIRTELGNAPTGELTYREAENAFLLKPYRVPGMYYQVENLTVNLKRYSDPMSIRWFAVMIAPAGEIHNNAGAHYQSITNGPNETKGDYQGWAYDPDKNPFVNTAGLGWGDSTSLVGTIMVGLQSSKNTNIQALIDKQATERLPWATFGTCGLLMQRWIDDRFSPLTQPWEGRLGWPLGEPFIDRNGRVLVGALGQYYRYGQYFEKGYIWWNDYIDPNTPDELYIYMYSKDSTLDQGGTYTQDPMVVRYGLGGPLGMAITANPRLVNVGDPVYFHGFPYGGPPTNANGFTDDIFVWNFRDGNYFVGDGTKLNQINAYFTEAAFTTRVLLVLDVNGDGVGDGATPGNYVFADAPEVTVGHLGSSGGGGGGKTILLVQDDTGGGMGNSAQHRQAFIDDLNALGFSSLYDLKTTGQVTSVSVLTPYKMVIWCTARYDNFYLELVSSSERTILTSYITGGGNVMWCTNTGYNGGGGYPSWQYLFGSGLDWAFYAGYDTMGILTGGPGATGPAGSITYINKNALWTSFDWSYDGIQPNSTRITYSNMYTDAYTAMTRDNLPSSAGGRTVTFGVPWNEYTTTSPSGPGRKGVLWNILNYVDPAILAGGGGPGGEDPILPYDGPVDIADVFAWVYNTKDGEIIGGDGDDSLHRAWLSITSSSGSKVMYFECMARSKAAVNLVYQWEFEPGAGYSTWTKYTSHYYAGAIDPDGPGGPLLPGDPFPVNVRVYNSSYGSYDLAPSTERDMDSVLVEVHGALPVDIMDNGSTFPGKTFVPDVNGDITFDVLFKIQNGDPPYDSVWIDYDYNFVTFVNRTEVTPTPGEGASSFPLTIADVVPGHSYYVAIRVNNALAPNLMDTYVWSQPVKGGAYIAVINDSGTANKTAITTDLTALGAGYTELDRSQISSGSDLAAYKVVIWCTGQSYGSIDSTEENIMINYVTVQHGNLFLPYQYLYGNYNYSFYNMLGSQTNFWTWFGNWWPCSGNDYYGNPYVCGSGPGGSISQLDTNYISPATEGYYWYYQGGGTETKTLVGEPNYTPWYIEGLAHDNYMAGDGGKAAWIGMQWNDITGTTPSTPGRKGALWNIIEHLDSTII